MKTLTEGLTYSKVRGHGAGVQVRCSICDAARGRDLHISNMLPERFHRRSKSPLSGMGTRVLPGTGRPILSNVLRPFRLANQPRASRFNPELTPDTLYRSSCPSDMQRVKHDIAAFQANDAQKVDHHTEKSKECLAHRKVQHWMAKLNEHFNLVGAIPSRDIVHIKLRPLKRCESVAPWSPIFPSNSTPPSSWKHKQSSFHREILTE